MSAVGTIVRTGSICPESGSWKVVGTPSTTAPIARGNRMPPSNGKAVDWQLIQYAWRKWSGQSLQALPRPFSF